MPYFSFLLALAVLGQPVWATGGRATQPLDVLQQAQDLPDGFADHFFDVPLAVRILVDGQLLGEGEIVLGKDTSVQLLTLSEGQESALDERTRQRWVEVLAAPHRLGPCQGECANGILALEYSLENSQLSVLTTRVESGSQQARYHPLPAAGSYGALMRHQLNLTLGEEEQRSGRYNLTAQGSLGQWTPLLEGELSQFSGQPARHHVQQLYAEREGEGHFYRLGYFSPYAQGLVRQPTLFGGGTPTVLGVMLGDSDTLLVEQGKASTVPLYVTPSRPGMVEIYKDGLLINSQQVGSGLQALDTRVLPTGIYEVELRVLEDGQVSERRREMIYKPGNWQNPEETWRFNLFAGRQTRLLSNGEEERPESMSGGVMLNHLLTPSVVLGASSQYIDRRWQHGLSADWSPGNQWRLFGNLMASQGVGTGFDLQALYHYGDGSLVLSHQQQRYRAQESDLVQSSLSLQQRLDEHHSANLYLAQREGQGLGTDLGWRYNGELLGQGVSWNLTVFDRPGSISTDQARDRGSMLSLSMNLGGERSQLAIGLGSRTSRSGGQERNASLGYQQRLAWGALQSVGANLTTDSYGVGVAGHARFQGAFASGDAHLLSSSYNRALSGGLNLDSTLAFGDEGTLTLTGQSQGGEAGMIVDLESDLPELALRADDDQGGHVMLRPGRNLVPVTAYRSGAVQLDMAGAGAPSVTIRPNLLPYHLNKGGVAYHRVRAMKTVTVIGRLLDGQGSPIKGAMVVNHAGRTVSEADGFFAVEMSERNPSLQVEYQGAQQCDLALDTARSERQQDLLLLGDLVCSPEIWASQ
ncbi:CS1-pili formation C-terminal domain-containing protein [Aeromonas bivalvium]|uniref:CS1-pili formation C-terminal domain-containing protein n=1 Tax=Aeromonas bivalvium TaxID=440079 RepID=UPI0038D01BF4